MPIDQIRNALVEQLGLLDAPPEIQAAVIDEVGGLALQRLSMLIYTQLSETDRQTFDTLNESRDTTGVQKFIVEKVTNLQQLSQQAITTEIKAFQEFQKSLPTT